MDSHDPSNWNRRFIKLSSNGQITIPSDFRHTLEMRDFIECTLYAGSLLLRSVPMDLQRRAKAPGLPDPAALKALSEEADRILEGVGAYDTLHDLHESGRTSFWQIRYSPVAAAAFHRLVKEVPAIVSCWLQLIEFDPEGHWRESHPLGDLRVYKQKYMRGGDDEYYYAIKMHPEGEKIAAVMLAGRLEEVMAHVAYPEP